MKQEKEGEGTRSANLYSSPPSQQNPLFLRVGKDKTCLKA